MKNIFTYFSYVCYFRYFPTTTSFIDSAVRGGGLVVVNCVMGWSRSASVVAAYLVMKHKMKATKVRISNLHL